MSRQSEERNRDKFAEKMRQKNAAAKAPKPAVKKTPAPESGAESNKKD
jgi:hypothetical protein